MKKSGLMVVAGLLLLSASAFAEMDCDKGMGGCGPEKQCCGMENASMKMQHGKKMGMMESMKKDLNLTDDQAAQIEAIKTTCKTDCQQRSEAIKAAREAKQAAMKQMPQDYATAKLKIQEIDALQTQNKIACLEMQEKINAVLTPEQQQKHAQMMAECKDKMKEKAKDKMKEKKAKKASK